MSRSVKKHNVVKVKDGSPIFNRKERRVNKQRLHEGKEPLQRNEIIDSYDVIDYKCIDSESHNKRK